MATQRTQVHTPIGAPLDFFKVREPHSFRHIWGRWYRMIFGSMMLPSFCWAWSKYVLHLSVWIFFPAARALCFPFPSHNSVWSFPISCSLPFNTHGHKTQRHFPWSLVNDAVSGSVSMTKAILGKSSHSNTLPVVLPRRILRLGHSRAIWILF